MSTRRALAFSFLDRYAGLVMSIVSSVFIARLLTPAEIGAFSVTMVLLTFISAMRDFGAGLYLLREPELTTERIRAAWTVSLGTGIFFAAIVLAAAKPVALLYGDARMFHIMLVLAVNFTVNPFGSLTYAWLMREMRFDALAMMRFLSGLAGACTSVFLAWRGFGPISLAIGSLLTTVTNSVVGVHYRPRHFPWKPGLYGIRQVLSYGGRFSVGGLLGVISAGAPELLLGKLQSLADAAMFSRANGLASMFQRMVMDGTQAVAMPVFAKESREVGNMNASFILAQTYVTALGWSFFIGLALLAHPAIRLLYGFQWDAAVDATRWVAMACAIGLPAALCPSALIARGAPSAMMRTSAETLAVQVIFVAIGAPFGLDAASCGFFLSGAAGLVLWLRATHTALGYSRRELGAAMMKSAAVAGTTSMAPLAVVLFFGWRPDDRLTPILLAIVGALPLFVVATYLTNHPLKREFGRVLAWRRSRR